MNAEQVTVVGGTVLEGQTQTQDQALDAVPVFVQKPEDFIPEVNLQDPIEFFN